MFQLDYLDWTEVLGRWIGLPYIDQQLGIARFTVGLEAACAGYGILFQWRGHYLNNPRSETEDSQLE